MAMIPCPKCGESISEQSKFCIHCGSKFVKDVCPACGTEIEENAKFCANCGNQIEKSKPTPAQKAETVEAKAEQKEEAQEVPGPYEIVEGWKQSSPLARFLCSGWFTFVDILFTMLIIVPALSSVAMCVVSIFILKEEFGVYICSLILAISISGLMLRILLNGELIPFYFKFSISRWIEKQGYDPLAIAKKISKTSRQEDIRSAKITNSMSTYVLHPYVSTDAAFMVVNREGKKQAIISLIISIVFSFLSMFVLTPLCFMVFCGSFLDTGTGGFDFFLNFIISFLVNPLFWIEIVLLITDTIVSSIINSKREKRKSVWLSSVYQ